MRTNLTSVAQHSGEINITIGVPTLLHFTQFTVIYTPNSITEKNLLLNSRYIGVSSCFVRESEFVPRVCIHRDDFKFRTSAHSTMRTKKPHKHGRRSSERCDRLFRYQHHTRCRTSRRWRSRTCPRIIMHHAGVDDYDNFHY